MTISVHPGAVSPAPRHVVREQPRVASVSFPSWPIAILGVPIVARAAICVAMLTAACLDVLVAASSGG